MHRLKDAKLLLHGTEADVLAYLATWRKSVMHLFANNLAQNWFFHSEWLALQGRSFEDGVSLQRAVAGQATKLIETTEVVWTSEAPKLKLPFMAKGSGARHWNRVLDEKA